MCRSWRSNDKSPREMMPNLNIRSTASASSDVLKSLENIELRLWTPAAGRRRCGVCVIQPTVSSVADRCRERSSSAILERTIALDWLDSRYASVGRLGRRRASARGPNSPIIHPRSLASNAGWLGTSRVAHSQGKIHPLLAASCLVSHLSGSRLHRRIPDPVTPYAAAVTSEESATAPGPCRSWVWGIDANPVRSHCRHRPTNPSACRQGILRIASPRSLCERRPSGADSR